MGRLTVGLVEELQQAVRRGRPVADHVIRLTDATLAGLLEYGCLRWAVADDAVIPPLPTALLSGPLGQALLQVRSALGPRSTGPQRRHLKSVDTQEAEFYVLEGDEASAEPAWEDFQIRFVRSAVASGFTRTIANGLSAALQEMADNACLHARSPAGALVGYHVPPGAALFCVVDVGIGVLESLRSHHDYAHLQLHRDALLTALQDGASRFGRGQGGYGFRQVFKALADQYGQLRFRSGQGCICMAGTGLDVTVGDARIIAESLPGFQVTVCCRTHDAVSERPLL
jgi:hypothetical protein